MAKLHSSKVSVNILCGETKLLLIESIKSQQLPCHSSAIRRIRREYIRQARILRCNTLYAQGFSNASGNNHAMAIEPRE